MGQSSDWIHYDGTVKAVTERAVKLIIGDKDDGAVWLPKSQIRGGDKITYKTGEKVTVEIPEWLAKEKDSELGGY